ncbi:PIN domain nuclease [Arvimicrobium flavum]|uniref:type II toxin-antitoxin system VapC family toxin n=1 Tax=Arvimicrobium flavum TaxID=3393320 RepID=UPI00237A65FB|nr:PIN domain nuclease [Mesorhizobium shangrilense]
MIVVDTSVWIAHIRNTDSAPVRTLRSVTDPDQVLVGDIVLLEVLRGARDDLHARRIAVELKKFATVPMLDVAIAVTAAQHYRSLRALGITINKTADLIIASYCLHHDHRLLHFDRDYEPFERHLGLKVVPT